MWRLTALLEAQQEEAQQEEAQQEETQQEETQQEEAQQEEAQQENKSRTNSTVAVIRQKTGVHQSEAASREIVVSNREEERIFSR